MLLFIQDDFSLQNHVPDNDQGYPLFIRIALVIIVISVLGSIAVYLVILFTRIISAYHDYKKRKAQKLVSNKLNNYLFFMESLGRISRKDFKLVTEEIRKVQEVPLRKRLVKQVFIDEMIYLKKNFTDQTARILGRLYQNLGLTSASVEKIHNRSWEVKAKGIIELREMAPFLSADDIVPYLNSRNADLRVEAQAAYIGLNASNAFGFLTYAPRVLVEWHQIILFDIITKNKEIIIPSFDTWLISTNPSVVTFCIKLIVHFMQFESLPELMRLLDHPNKQVVNRAINALGKLEAVKAEPRIVDLYRSFDLGCKIEVLKALGRIGSREYMDFLETEFLHSDNYYIQMQAMYARLALTNESSAEVLAALPPVDEQRTAIINHCLDKLI